MVVAKGGRIDLIVPRLGANHGDTIAGGRYFKKGVVYPGDTAVLLNDLFKHVFVRGEIPALKSGSNSFTNFTGDLLSVTNDQVKSDAKVASNGYYYLLDNVTVPEIFYRKELMFLPVPLVQSPADPGKTIPNPYILYSNEANTSPTVVGSGICYTGKYTRFNFTKVGAMIDFVIPYVPKGSYKVVLCYFPEANHGIVGVSYGNQQIFQDLNTSTQLNNRIVASIAKELGVINVINHGPVQIKFTCTNSNLMTFNQYTFGVDYLKLIPVNAP